MSPGSDEWLESYQEELDSILLEVMSKDALESVREDLGHA